MSLPSMVKRCGNFLMVRSIFQRDKSDLIKEKVTSKTFAEKPLPDLPDCKVKRNYSCGKCDYFTQNPRHYLYHLRDVHVEKVNIYECPNCLYASKHFQKLLRHSKMVHGAGKKAEIEQRVKKIPKSPTLPVATEDSSADENGGCGTSDNEDDQIIFSSKILKCSVCAFTAKSQVMLSRHEKEEHIKTKFFRCSKCTYATHMKARFTKHVKYHSMPMVKCDTCDFRTPYKWNLDRHCKNHNGNGALKCSTCNFTADIKQSLTVHEMNHHVPPVGHAAGFGVGRRRNKVGASDSAAAEEAALVQQVDRSAAADDVTDTSVKVIAKGAGSTATASSKDSQSSQKRQYQKLATALSDYNRSPFGSDFVNPEDIVQYDNGNIYFKNKCKLCNYKSAWDSEMTKHEAKVHNIVKDPPQSQIPLKSKKTQRPIPNLIPINQLLRETKSLPEPVISQKDFREICAKSTNSALKDFAPLMDAENMFKHVPDLIPTSLLAASVNDTKYKLPQHANATFKQKNASFFDQLKEKLMIGRGADVDLTCKYCNHHSKCLSEQVKHQKTCTSSVETSHVITRPNVFISSSRCQYCRQRCKSSVDLYNHLQNCTKANKTINELAQKETTDTDTPPSIENQNQNQNMSPKSHPMENRVFVWNNIEVPMDVDVDDSNYEYTEDKVDDTISLDFSIRTQSPESSENSFLETETVASSQASSTSTTNLQQTRQNTNSAALDKIPTHGTDISIAQHKKVFQCPHCTFWASTASRFHVHIVGHLNKKPFECSLCSYRSNWRWDITKHIKLKSVRDPAHETAKVLMTDETGRRNYTKYNKYLTEIHVSVDQSLDTSGGSGTRHKNQQTSGGGLSRSDKSSAKAPPITADFSSVIKNVAAATNQTNMLFAKLTGKGKKEGETKRTLFKCKKCNYRDASKDVLLQHVKGHYTTTPSPSASVSSNSSLEVNLGRSDADKDERHCRLKHAGDIRVVSNKNGQEKVEIEEQTDDPDHIDVVQTGTFKCKTCPFSNDDHLTFERHLEGHVVKPDAQKCHYCSFNAIQRDDLMDHLKLHGVADPEDFLSRLSDRGDSPKKFKCLVCPYVTNSKSQYTYHKQFHKPRGGQYSCNHCSYNVSKRHLLHQHLKVHGINLLVNSQKVDVEEVTTNEEEIEEVPYSQALEGATHDLQNFPDIPLVWVSKQGKFSKMFKCRFCPHVNLRKVNIQEHEKMHGIRERNPNSKGSLETEHHCNECNYVCNNAGVLSSHSKVHQGLSGTIHCLVDPSITDDEQIAKLSLIFNTANNFNNEEELVGVEDEDAPLELDEDATSTITDDVSQAGADAILYFCSECPARFLKESEYTIHSQFHGVRLFYKCEYCTFTSRQKPYLLAHSEVHTTEHQDRSKSLQNMYSTSPRHPQPRIYQITPNRSESIWIVQNQQQLQHDEDKFMMRMSKVVNVMNVPLSGTDLFQQKSEAERKCVAENLSVRQQMEHPPSATKVELPFGEMMQGNPNFIYPTTVKNGKTKEKRYKCPKCPSAFEKREQYKIHLGLHGSKQRYKCEICDYSVKYYANYVQHKKKHAMNDKALADKNASDEDLELDENEELLEETSSCTTIKEHLVDEKKPFTCYLCPYANYRKDAVENHLKRHVCVSGVAHEHTCELCDYSVPQEHFLVDHVKLHTIMELGEVKTDCEHEETLEVNNNEGEKEYLNCGIEEFGGMAKSKK